MQFCRIRSTAAKEVKVDMIVVDLRSKFAADIVSVIQHLLNCLDPIHGLLLFIFI